MSRIFTLRPVWLALLAALATLALLPVAAWHTTSDAKAESGRRLCIYVENYDKATAAVKALKLPETGTGTGTGTSASTGTVSYTAYAQANLTVVLDYKRDGKCPDVYSLTIDGQTIPLSYPDNVPGVEQPKIDCEDLYTTAGIVNTAAKVKGEYRGPANAAAGAPSNPDLGLTTNEENPRKGTDVCTKMDDDVLYAFWTLNEEVTLDVNGKPVKATPGDFVTTRLWGVRR